MFLRNVLAALVALFIFAAFSVAVFIGLATVISSSSSEAVDIKENSVLRLKLDRPILERSVDNPLMDLQFGGGTSGVGVKEITSAIIRAAGDDRISGIYLEPDFLYAGLSKLKEIRDALTVFQDSSKFIVCYSEYLTESEYYLASVADELYVPEEGIIEFNGFRAEYNFLKGGMDKLGVKTQVFRVGAYKSAVEPFTRTEMSDEAREQTESLLTSIYGTYLNDIAASRSVSEDHLRMVADSMLATNARDAEEYKLISETLYIDQVNTRLKELLELDDEDDDIDFVGVSGYLGSSDALYSGSNKIAVVFADGEIINGKGDREYIASEPMVKQLTKLREDDRVQAIVLRINSPGGSSLASDVIWREIEKTTEIKPVIASMSDVAASGGYYLAMACDSILAQPTTITGSIGIYSMYFNAEELLEDKLGITTDVVKTGPLSDVFTVSRSFTEYERALFQKSVDEGYETFTTKAAAGRDMEVQDLKQIAQGRVWSGTQAVANGLVDRIGGLHDAIAVAAKSAELEDDYRVVYYPVQKSPWEQLISDLGGGYEESAMKEKLGAFYPIVNKLKNLSHYQGLQARMPFDLIIE